MTTGLTGPQTVVVGNAPAGDTPETIDPWTGRPIDYLDTGDGVELARAIADANPGDTVRLRHGAYSSPGTLPADVHLVGVSGSHFESCGPCSIGSRQTVDTVELPGFGRGQLAWRNGPCRFFPVGGGPPIEVASVGGGGASSNPPRSWRRVTMPGATTGIDAELVVTGEHHVKEWSPLFGDGWLITSGGVVGANDPDRFVFRFEADDGTERVRFRMAQVSVGRPAYAAKMAKSHSRMPLIDDPDEMNWATYTDDNGGVMTFRRGGPRPEGFVPLARESDYKLLTPRARKAYDDAKSKASGGSGTQGDLFGAETPETVVGSTRAVRSPRTRAKPDR